MKKCKYCGCDVHENDPYIDDSFEDGYCNKLHRKYHEKILIQEGKMEGLECGDIYIENFPLKDEIGNKIWFPKDGKPYYDRVLKKNFNTAEEKQSYMKEKGLVMEGTTFPTKPPIEAGDMRHRSYRRAMRMED